MSTLDRDVLRVCPYDSSHLIRSYRFECHILKCKKNSTKKMLTCPFNAKHLVPLSEMKNHTLICEDRFRLAYELQVISEYEKGLFS
jgi:hypothetical protein